MRESKLLNWKTDSTQICSIIKSSYAPFKIVLKIKDDSEMFADFFNYHSKIVGPQNIYVFDNESSDTDLLSQYESLPDRSNVFRFDTFHNDIHYPEKFKDLYEALQSSCRHFTFLDSDERLCLIEGSSYSTSIEKYLEGKEGIGLPGIWLSNAPGSKDIFNIGSDGKNLESGITWGKPILSSESKIDGYLNHNIQALEYVYNGLDNRSVFVLHLNNLSPTQRIKANIRKLVARGFLHKDASIEDAISAQTTANTDLNIRLYIDEIRRLHTSVLSNTTELSAGQIKLGLNGVVSCYSALEENSISRFLSPELSTASVSKDRSSIRIVNADTSNDRELNQSHLGHVEGIFSGKITGWAVDGFGNSSSVKIFINGVERLILHTLNDRNDLKKSGISKGQGGFCIDVRGLLRLGENEIRVTFIDEKAISGGPMKITV